MTFVSFCLFCCRIHMSPAFSSSSFECVQAYAAARREKTDCSRQVLLACVVPANRADSTARTGLLGQAGLTAKPIAAAEVIMQIGTGCPQTYHMANYATTRVLRVAGKIHGL